MLADVHPLHPIGYLDLLLATDAPTPGFFLVLPHSTHPNGHRKWRPVMNRPIIIARTTVLVAGIIQLVLGALFWSGIGRNLIPVHATIGTILVLALWTVAYFAARMGAPKGLVALTVVWGLIVPVFGTLQTGILPGSPHWIIQVVHLLLGLAALALSRIVSDAALHRQTAAA